VDQAELDDANERGAGARIEFKPEGHAKITITISRELVECARALEFTIPQLSHKRSGWQSLAHSTQRPTSSAAALGQLPPLSADRE